MSIPGNLKYTESHEWVKAEGDSVLIGITDHAQHELGDLVFINLPNTGDAVNKGEAFADVESVKAVSDIISPVSGRVSEVNEALLDTPELINQDAYAAWIIRVKEAMGMDDLLTPGQYEELLRSED
jgi:glycine cleavage system H protein